MRESTINKGLGYGFSISRQQFAGPFPKENRPLSNRERKLDSLNKNKKTAQYTLPCFIKLRTYPYRAPMHNILHGNVFFCQFFGRIYLIYRTEKYSICLMYIYILV